MLADIRFMTLAAFASFGLFLAGCNGGAADDHDDHDDDNGHSHTDGDADHDHADDEEAHDHDHAGAQHDLGTHMAGAHELTVVQIGDAMAGEEVVIEIEFADASTIAAVRTWLGTENGDLFGKALAEAADDHYHAHIEVPDPLEAEHQLWIEVEDDSGEISTVSVPLEI